MVFFGFYFIDIYWDLDNLKMRLISLIWKGRRRKSLTICVSRFIRKSNSYFIIHFSDSINQLSPSIYPWNSPLKRHPVSDGGCTQVTGQWLAERLHERTNHIEADECMGRQKGRKSSLGHNSVSASVINTLTFFYHFSLSGFWKMFSYHISEDWIETSRWAESSERQTNG